MNLIHYWKTVVTISLFGFIAVTTTRVLLSIYFQYSRPTISDPTSGRINEYCINRHTVFLTDRELKFVGSGLVPIAIVFWIVGLIISIIFARL